MKKQIILFFFCLMAISVSIQAQKSSHHGGKHHLERMKADLDLSDEQIKQVEEMDQSLREEMKTLKTSDLSMEEKHAKMKELKEKKKGLMANILSTEQLAKMEEMHAKKKGMHRGKGKKGGMHGKMKADLDLSDEQSQQMEEMGKSLKGEMKAIKDSDLSMEEKHAKMKELGEKKKGLMNKILTTEQIAKMEAMHADKKAMHKEKKESMKKFMDEKVKPLMTAKRAELDKQLKKKDRKQINKLRAIAKEMREEIKAKHDEMRKKFENGEKPAMGMHKGKRGKHGMKHRGPKGHGKRELMKFKEEHEAEFKQAEAYATQYATEIDQLMEEAAAQMKEWKMEMKGDKGQMKRGKSCDKAGKACCKEDAKSCCKGGSKSCDKSARKPGMADDKMEERKNHKRIGFLLAPSKMEDEPKTRETVTTNILESKVYPNPSSDSNTLEINVPAKAQYSIELYNEVGSKLKLISNSKLDKGNHSFQVDLSDLPSGLYYYVISNGKEKTSQKFMKN